MKKLLLILAVISISAAAQAGCQDRSNSGLRDKSNPVEGSRDATRPIKGNQ